MRAMLSGSALLLTFISLTACQGSSVLAPVSSAPNLPWPPPESGAIKAVRSVVDVLGKDFAAAGGDYGPLGDDLILSASGGYSYAIYSISGLSMDNECRHVSLESTGTFTNPSPSAHQYVGLANYFAHRWDWYATDDPQWGMDLSSPPDYRSLTGQFAIAVVLSGAGNETIQRLHFTVDVQGTLPAPTNLAATAEVQLITLDWDDVAEAQGYNVYRGYAPDFAAPELINTELVPASDYTDYLEDPYKGMMLYYCVTAMGYSESPYSNMVDIFSPELDMPAPTNPHKISDTENSATVGWDWPGTQGPTGGFDLYYSETPNFNPDDPSTTHKLIPTGNSRSNKLTGLVQGVTYYWRICGRTNGGLRGRMTDDIPVSCGGSWNWGPLENIGAGREPMSTVVTDSDLAVGYLHPTLLAMKLAIRDNGTWTAEDTLLDEEYDPAHPGGVTNSLTLAYGAGQYLAAAHYGATVDLFGAVRDTNGTWTREDIEAEHSTGLGVPNEGQYCRAASDGTDFAVLYIKDSTTERLATRPIAGGSWTYKSITNLSVPATYHSLAFHGGDLGVLVVDAGIKDLLFGLRSENFSLQDIANTDTNRGVNNDLTWVLDAWMTPAYDPTDGDKSLYAITGSGTSWNTATIAAGSNDNQQGQSARLAAYSTGSYCLWKGTDSWHFANYNGTSWAVYGLAVSGVTITSSIELEALNDEPYIIFIDNNDDMLKCAKGTPPT